MSRRKHAPPIQTMPPEQQPNESPTKQPRNPPEAPPPTDEPRREREPGPQREYGEGNYAASKRYNDATKHYVDTQDVEQDARDAEPETLSEARQLGRAEEAGRRRAKEEDPIPTRRSR